MGNIFPAGFDSLIRMHECGVGNYWFYHIGSAPTQEPLYYKQLIASAQTKISIWDPYFNISDSDQQVFDGIQDNITLKLLTIKGLDGPRSYLTNVQTAMKLKIGPTKNLRFGMRVINKGDLAHQGGWLFHDRFLILDNAKVYLVGSSIGYHLSPHASTGIFRVHDLETSAFIISLFDTYWNNAGLYELPISYLHT